MYIIMINSLYFLVGRTESIATSLCLISWHNCMQPSQQFNSTVEMDVAGSHSCNKRPAIFLFSLQMGVCLCLVTCGQQLPTQTFSIWTQLPSFVQTQHGTDRLHSSAANIDASMLFDSSSIVCVIISKSHCLLYN
ncbi:TPA: hypothetical protein ACH3X2_007844 [Trebouxia sp. C0005]